MSGSGGTSSLSHDFDLEDDFVAPLSQGQHHPALQNKDLMGLKTGDPSRCDSGIGNSITSITSSLASFNDSIESSDSHAKPVSDATVSNVSQSLERVSLRDDGIGLSITSSLGLSDLKEFSDSEKIKPSLAKNLSTVESQAKDEGFHSYPLASTNINETEVDFDEVLAEQDEDGDTMIHTAVVSEKESVALALIDIVKFRSKCLDVVNKLFQTALHIAVLTRQRKVVQKLASKGCDMTMRDQQGNTALHIACRDGSEKLVKDMVGSLSDDVEKRKELFSIRNCEGLTCLHLAAQGHYYEIIGYLFAKGADVNIGDAKSGRTILHYAAERKDVETVVVLLTHPSIDIDCETYKGETPLLLAYWRNYQDIVKRLKANGAYFSYELVENDDEGDDS